jgi:hypothetical protein
VKPELPELPKRDNPSEANSDNKSESQVETKLDTKSDTKLEIKSEPNSDSKPESKPSFAKPKLYVEPDPTPSQHIRVLECNKEISRIFYECYHCKQGFLLECQGTPPLQEIDVKCSNCGKTSIKLLTNKVISTTAIPSPWGS